MEDRLSWKDLVQKDNNPLNNNLLPNVAINNKQSFDEGNSTINRLNEEILELKRKTQFVNEKDRQIKILENKVNGMKSEIDSKNKKIIELNNQIQLFQDLNLNIDTNELEHENIMLKNKLKELNNNRYKEQRIILNIERVKKIIEIKSGYRQDDKVNFVINKYKLKNNDYIDRSLLSKIIQEIL